MTTSADCVCGLGVRSHPSGSKRRQAQHGVQALPGGKGLVFEELRLPAFHATEYTVTCRAYPRHLPPRARAPTSLLSRGAAARVVDALDGPGGTGGGQPSWLWPLVGTLLGVQPMHSCWRHNEMPH